MDDEEVERVEDEESAALDAVMQSAEFALMAVIVARLAKMRKGGATYADARRWQAEDMARIRRVLAKAQSVAEKGVSRLGKKAVELSEKWAAPFYEHAGKQQKPIGSDVFAKAAMEKAEAEQRQKVADLTRSNVLGLVQHDGRVESIEGYYQNLMDRMVGALSEADRNEIIDRTVNALAAHGVKVRYASGATRDLYSAVSQNVLDGFRSRMQDIRDRQAEEFGADGVEISAHGVCAEDHRPYQGRQYTHEEFATIQKKLRRPFGKWNCRHRVTPVILGVSSETYSRRDVEELDRLSTRKTGVKNAKGEDMDAYAFSQWQRQRETLIRKKRIEAALLERGGGEENRAKSAALQSEIKALSADYYQKSRKAKVPTRPQRLEAYELKL